MPVLEHETTDVANPFKLAGLRPWMSPKHMIFMIFFRATDGTKQFRLVGLGPWMLPEQFEVRSLLDDGCRQTI